MTSKFSDFFDSLNAVSAFAYGVVLFFIQQLIQFYLL